MRIQKDDPREQEAFAKIDKLEIDFPDDLKIKDPESGDVLPFCIQGKHRLNFSSNLTCVIGGRGSGKSSLVHILYNIIPNKDVERLNDISSPLFNLQLSGKDGLAKVRSLTKAEIPPRTEYFLQNEVERFAKDVNEMSSLVLSRLYGLSAMDESQNSLAQIKNEWQGAAGGMESLVTAYDRIVGMNQQIEMIEKQKATLKKQTEVIRSKEYQQSEKAIKELANTISAFESFEKEYKKILADADTLTKSIGRLDWSGYESQAVLASLSSELEKKSSELRESFLKDKQRHDKSDYAGKLRREKAALKTFLAEKGLPAESVSEVAAATQQIADCDEKIKLLKREQAPLQEIYDKKSTTLDAYRIAYDAFKSAFEMVAQILRRDLTDLKFDDQQASISFQLKANDQLLRDAISEFVKNHNPSKTSLRSDAIQTVFFGNPEIKLADLIPSSGKINEAVSKCTGADAHTQVIKELLSDTTFVERLHLRMQLHFYDINNIQVQTKLGEKSLQNTSFGERCGIVLAIVLVAGTNPIIVDQPEDNLDGKYISRVLVPLIRTQKQRRQIILVTRDANIVVGGDAELILILNRDKQGTVLSPATIENKGRRPEYIWILDGGESAFQKREEKYSIPKRI